MFIRNLKIEKNGSVIRDILFHKGLNLIIDETRTPDLKESGNSLGKTTIIRLIDFSLGSDGKNIYQDTEFRQKTNTQIEDFLTNNNVVITLTLTQDFTDSTSDIVIRRNFLSRNDKIQEINGEKYSNDEFPKTLKELVFNSTTKKPTFRQIIAKNIRDEKSRLNNTLKVLNPFTSQDEYEALYLFWLGVDLDAASRKQKLSREQSIEENLQKRLKKDNSLSQIEQSLLIINRTIEELEEKKHNLDTSKKYKDDIDELNSIKFQLNVTTTDLNRLSFRKNLIIESKNDLESETSDLDTSEIKSLYEEAKILIPNIHKSFEETLKFHNTMVQEKMKYITQELPELEHEISQIKGKIDILALRETELSHKLKRIGLMESLGFLIVELNRSYEQRGELEGIKRIWDNSIEKLSLINKELTTINEGIQTENELIQSRIAEFNKYFSSLSYELYGERFVLSSAETTNGLELNISSISGNLGTGKKKGQIAAFDLAYIQFAEALNIDCIHFIMHDQIENIHNNQISLLSGIVTSINCQYIVPILRDKLPENLNVEGYKIISLSQDDKLFKVA